MNRFLLTCIVPGVAVACLGAQSFSYPSFNANNMGQLNLVGSSQVADSRLRLTSQPLESSWAWHTQYMPVLGFDTTFTFRVQRELATPAGRGFAFVFRGVSNPTGGQLQGLGYGGAVPGVAGITNSVAVEFDTFQEWFLGDSSNNEVSIHTRGPLENSEHEDWSLARTTPSFTIDDGQWHTCKIRYVVGSLEVYLDDLTTPMLAVPYDFALGGALANGSAVGGVFSPGVDELAVGFTATTGPIAYQKVDIGSWEWQSLSVETCGGGTLGADTLLLNGTAGGAARSVDAALGAPFDLAIDNPPAFGAGAPYLVFASLQTAPWLAGSSLGFGNACFPMLPMGPGQLVLLDGFGFGAGILSGAPTPHVATIPGNLIPVALDLTFQAVTLASSSPLSLGLTNAIEVRVANFGPPTMTSVSAVGGIGTILGSGFLAGMTVQVAGATVPAEWISSSEVLFTVPGPSPCAAQVQLTNPDGQSATIALQSFVVGAPIVAGGPASGGNFTAIPCQPTSPGMTVTVGGVSAPVFNTINIFVVIQLPPGSPGPAQVVVTDAFGCTGTTTYTYL